MASAEPSLPAMPGPFIAFQLKHIGDFLTTLPALALIKEHWPDEKTAVAVSPEIAPLAALFPWLDDCIIIDRESGPLAFCGGAAKIRRAGFGTAFIFDGQARSVLCARLAGIKRRVGARDICPLKFRRAYTHDVDIEAKRLDSRARRGQDMVAVALGLSPEPLLRPPLSKADPCVVAPLLGELKGRGPRVGLTLAGRQHEKSWPLASFAALCRRLWDAFGARMFVTGGPDESGLAAALARGSGVPAANFCGRTDLPQLLALARASDLFITVDTGTAHLTALTETPIISIFTWTNPALWPPQSPNAHILCYDWALSRFGLKADEGPWLAAPAVTPEMVFEKAAEILGTGSSGAT